MNTRKLKPIHELNRLSEAERAQLWTDLENGLSYSRAIRVVGTEHFVTIRRHRLFTWWHRENDRRAMNAYLPAENQLSAIQLLDLLNAQSLPWSDLMHGRILQAGFLLANREDNTPAQLLTLQRLANNPFQQHLATEKLDLSKRGLALREKQLAARAAKSNSSSFGNRDSSSSGSPREDHLGPLAKNMDGVEARAKMKFGSISDAAPVPLTPELQFGDDTVQGKASTVSTVSTESSQPTSSLCASRSSVEEPPAPSSQLASVSSVNSVVKESRPLESRVNQYTLERYHEALNGKDTLKVGKWNAWKFKSKMQWCPCGKHLPCPEHGDFPPHFWELMPDCGDYIHILQRKGLPYTNPQIFMQQQEKRAKRLAAEKELFLQWPDENARTSMLLERAKSHALRRWYSHTPRPRGTPPPDESWTEECPCGAKYPCDRPS